MTPAPNPKAARAVADGKAPLDYLEPACDDGEARVLRGGALRYGRRNYRDTETLWTTYLGSMRRHLNALFRGEDTDPDSGEHHLSHIRANAAVLQGAMDAGTLKDDRLDKVSTPLSDRVHIDGDQDAKCGVAAQIGQRAEAAAMHVEPFVVDAACCCGPGVPLDDNCVAYADIPCVYRRGPTFPEPPAPDCGPDCCTTPCGSIF